MEDAPHPITPHLTPPPHPFADLRWYRVRATLKNTRTAHKKAHPLVILDAIQKSVTGIVASGLKTRPYTIFHFEDPPEDEERLQGVYHVAFFFLGCERVYAEFWRETMRLYFADETAERNFALARLSDVDERTYETLAQEQGAFPREGELCLTFRTPLPFTPETGKPRTHLSRDPLIISFEKRFSRLFGCEIRYSGRRDFEVLSHLWHYSEVRHGSRSQPGATQYINGCTGPLYIKGTYDDILPWLILGSELHAGTKVAHAQGHYRIERAPVPFFTATPPEESLIAQTIEEVLETFDDTEEDRVRYGEEGARNELAHTLAQTIADGSYLFSPAHAFTLHRGEKERTIEVPAFEDRVVLKYLARTLTPHFDRLFEESSVGYRKGLSRTHAVARIRALVGAGYQYVIKSDIDDFFPSVDHATLSALLTRYLPHADTALHTLIMRACATGSIAHGVHVPRNKGLSQGSPLSPLLANLYLDSFDEGIRDAGVPMVRYADDFLLFTHTKEEADALMSHATALLADIGLALKTSKTCVVSVEEEFSFIGVRFMGMETEGDPGETFERTLKQPLYVVEQYTYLSIAGDSVIVKKNGTVLEHVPLHRISEIILLGRAVLSTALLHRCVQRAIPVTLVLESGYCVASVQPDSKKYHAYTHLHALRYEALSEHERLAIAKDIASAKLTGFASLVRQKRIEDAHILITTLEQSIRRIQCATDTAEIRGIEGFSAKQCYVHMNALVQNPAFHFHRRLKRNPDRINALLNFGYHLLFTRIRVSLCAMGLNPYLGFLHSPADNYESLVCDLQEPFRARIVRLVVRCINVGIIEEDDFRETSGGMRLSSHGVRKFLAQFEAEMNKRTAHDKHTLKDDLYIQALVVKQWAEGKGSLTVYRWE